jgi:hypothetical protein
MPLLSTIGAAAARAFGFLKALVAGYEVDNSLRFNSGSSDYLSRTPASSSNRKTFTISTWVKRSILSSSQEIFSNNNNGFGLQFQSGDTFAFAIGTATDAYVYTNRVFRDVSAWYHLVFVVDTTQATDSNRMKMYVNGVQETSFSTTVYPAQNLDTNIITVSIQNQIGTNVPYTSYFNGYLSEFYLIDGQALTPSSFGETDTTTGIWKPKAYIGTFGTNGFYLQFKNSAALGTDSSGNGNNFTVNNLTSVDQSTDTCTNNFCTLNFIQNGNGTTSTLTEGNLVAGTADNKGCSATFGVNRGKWFWEVKNVGTQLNQRFGVSNRANEQDGDAGDPANTRSYVGASFYKNYNTTSSVSDAGFVGTNGAIFGFGLDLDNGTLREYVNGVLINTDTTLPSDNSVTFFPFTFVTFNFGNWNQAQFNFGSPMYAANSYTDAAGFGNFSYAVPSGYYSLCTKNLANFG